MKKVLALTLLVLPLCAQDAILADAKQQWTSAKTNILKAAQKFDESKYGYKASAEVRTFGGFVGHITDASVMFCSAVLGEKKSATASKLTAKADLVKALEDAFAYCDTAHASLIGAKAAETVKFFGGERSKVGVLFFNNMHVYEHYGNLVTYMRANGVVPPSSERN